MKLHGKLVDNLRAAVVSARRFHDMPVHADTLTYWTELLRYGRERQRRRKGDPDVDVDALLARLQSELAQRQHNE